MARTSSTQAEIASNYTLWCEYFDTLGIDSREDFDAMLNSEKMEMLAFGFGADVDVETAPPMTPARAAEVQTMYARAEAATAIVKAVMRWHATVDGAMIDMGKVAVDEALDAVHEAAEAYESISNEAQ